MMPQVGASAQSHQLDIQRHQLCSQSHQLCSKSHQLCSQRSFSSYDDPNILVKDLKILGSGFSSTICKLNSPQFNLTFNLALNYINLIYFKLNSHFVYKYYVLCFNKSVFNWTFSQLLTEKPNCTKICLQNRPLFMKASASEAIL